MKTRRQCEEFSYSTILGCIVLFLRFVSSDFLIINMSCECEMLSRKVNHAPRATQIILFTVDSCVNNACLNGATCAPDTYGDLYSCTCALGYFGKYCSVGEYHKMFTVLYCKWHFLVFDPKSTFIVYILRI
jgi:hypothetical protein